MTEVLAEVLSDPGLDESGEFSVIDDDEVSLPSDT